MFSDNLFRIWNTSPTDLFDNYVRFNQPVIIEDSHSIWNDTNDIFEFLQNNMDLSNSKPCDHLTNIVSNKSPKLNEILDLVISDDRKEDDAAWFLSFRNCEFSALKASRLLWPKPNYLPLHLKPFSSSWLIITDNYIFSKGKKLYLNGLIVLLQMVGVLNVQLEAKGMCNNECGGKLQAQLYAGEAIVFSSNIWQFSYSSYSSDKTISFIAEFEYNV